MSKYRWVYQRDSAGKILSDDAGRDLKLNDVGIRDDGTIHNPNDYPEELVRKAVLAADAARHERHSQAAKKGAETRRARQKGRTSSAAERMLGGPKTFGPRITCAICGKGLGDPVSIERGIGSECWQRVLTRLAARRAEGKRRDAAERAARGAQHG